jgi:ribosomal protein S18 acetylase RimI-like enzyme
MITIRHATLADIPTIKAIADANRATIGFVMRPTLEEAVRRGWLLVAEDGDVCGFCNFRHCRNGRTTIYEICIAESARGKGIGHLLIDTLRQEAIQSGQTHIALKCTVENPANLFYERMGFSLVGTEQGRKRALNVWRSDVGNALWTSFFAQEIMRG